MSGRRILLREEDGACFARTSDHSSGRRRWWTYIGKFAKRVSVVDDDEEDVEAFDQIGGVLPLNPRWLAENFPDSWPTAAAAKKDVSRQSKRGHLSNLITIRKVSPSGLQYKANGARKWSKCLSTSNDARHVEKVLESLLGQKVAVRLAKARP